MVDDWLERKTDKKTSFFSTVMEVGVINGTDEKTVRTIPDHTKLNGKWAGIAEKIEMPLKNLPLNGKMNEVQFRLSAGQLMSMQLDSWEENEVVCVHGTLLE